MDTKELEFKKHLFNKKIETNFKKLEIYYHYQFQVFCELPDLIDENINCLLLDLNQASILTTNHLLERMLKKALMDFYMIGCYINNCEFETKLIKAYQKYDKLLLNNTIDSAFDEKIISAEEKDKLIKLKNEFRNPYSHAQIGSITKDIPPVTTGYMGKIDDLLRIEDQNVPLMEIEIPSSIFAQQQQVELARLKAFDYFCDIFEIMKNIDEKYKKKKSEVEAKDLE